MNRRDALDRTLLIVRTLLPTLSEARILDALCRQRVRIVADRANAKSPAGQAAIGALATLVVSSGGTLDLDFPEVSLHPSQRSLRGSKLRSALEGLAADHILALGGNPVPIQADAYTVIIGSSLAPAGVRGCRISVEDWRGAIVPLTVAAMLPTAVWPFGALAGAAMAATEVFKVAMRDLCILSRIAVPPELEAVEFAEFSLGAPLTFRAVDLSDVGVISGGAITNAMLHVLLQVPELRGHLKVLDREVLDVPNLNRYPLMRLSDVGLPKVQVLERYATKGLQIEAVQRQFDGRLDAFQECATLVVGADSLQARWDAQKLQPTWLGVGATTDFFVQVSEHLPGKAGCARCAHPYDDGGNAPIPTISFVSYWAGLLLAARLVRNTAMGPAPRDERMTEMWALRLDNPHSAEVRQVPQSPRCPEHSVKEPFNPDSTDIFRR